MIVLDTSVWVEFFKANKLIAPLVGFSLEQNSVLAVECVFAELLQGCKSERERTIVIDYWNNLPHAETRNIWLEAGEYSYAHKAFSKGVGLIDLVVLVSARRVQAKVWTLDKKLLGILHKNEIYLS